MQNYYWSYWSYVQNHLQLKCSVVFYSSKTSTNVLISRFLSSGVKQKPVSLCCCRRRFFSVSSRRLFGLLVKTKNKLNHFKLINKIKGYLRLCNILDLLINTQIVLNVPVRHWEAAALCICVYLYWSSRTTVQDCSRGSAEAWRTAVWVLWRTCCVQQLWFCWLLVPPCSDEGDEEDDQSAVPLLTWWGQQ